MKNKKVKHVEVTDGNLCLWFDDDTSIEIWGDENDTDITTVGEVEDVRQLQGCTLERMTRRCGTIELEFSEVTVTLTGDDLTVEVE